ncbi:hypothetical protein [Chitinivibrio alkaliphilus]|uniref:Uncharacterized protein n=1 Tax=Chitinivibrio alkaliphilus ACht1 TaxID=1313304 RepID=U7DAR6_9BACT|nr:hypothetical protein [Chitinivibrio alkaliphilus]ERP39122.1 hypothetical protein CALK_0289 [Chitinivibrio alkaliphilus ACht1]
MNSKTMAIVVLLFGTFVVLLRVSFSLGDLYDVPRDYLESFGFHFHADSYRIDLRGRFVYSDVAVRTEDGQEYFRADTIQGRIPLFRAMQLRQTLRRGEEDVWPRLLDLRSVRIENISATVPFEETAAQVERGRLDIGGRGNSLRGIFSADRGLLGPFTVDSLSLPVTLEETQLMATSASLTLAEGVLTFDGLYDHEKKALQGNLRGDSLSLEALLPEARLGGQLSFSFSSDTLTIPDIRNPYRLSGNGRFSLEKFSDSESDYLQRARRELARIGIADLDFDHIGGDVRLRNGIVESHEISCIHDYYSLHLAGMYLLVPGTFAYSIEGRISPEFRTYVRPVIWDALIEDEKIDGGRLFYGTMEGRPEAYRVSVDAEIIKRGVRGFFRNIFN